MRILLMALLSLAYIGASFAQSDWAKVSHADYSVQHPKDWLLNDSGIMGTTFFIQSPPQSYDDHFYENVNLVIQDMDGQEMSLEVFSELSERQVLAFIEDAKIVENATISFAGKEAKQVIFKGKQNTFDLTFEQIYWLEKNQAFILTYTAESSVFEEYKKVAEKIMFSLNMN